MDYTAMSILIFCILVAMNMFWMAGKVQNIERMLQAIMDGGRFVVPKINDGMHRLELAIAAGKAIAGRVMKKRKNMGAPVTPDVDNGVLRQFARVLLREIEGSASIEDVKLTEPVWIKSGKFAEKVGGSPEQFRACMKRLEAARIAVVVDGRGTRGWAMPYRSITSKLKAIMKG